MGSISEISNSSGSIVEYYDYDVYGAPTLFNSSGTEISSSTVDNPYYFTGREYDFETGLYYYRARYYDPSIGIFLETDPIGYEDSMNLYSYTVNNPWNRVDPTGLITTLPTVYVIASPVSGYGPVTGSIGSSGSNYTNTILSNYNRGQSRDSKGFSNPGEALIGQRGGQINLFDNGFSVKYFPGRSSYDASRIGNIINKLKAWFLAWSLIFRLRFRPPNDPPPKKDDRIENEDNRHYENEDGVRWFQPPGNAGRIRGVKTPPWDDPRRLPGVQNPDDWDISPR